MSYQLTASVWQEDDLYVAKCVELGVASQGCSEEEALSNLKEAVELYLEDEETGQITLPPILPKVKPLIIRN